MIKPTGYWTFFCNPKRWNIDEFLKSGQVEDNYSISSHHKDCFSPGQIGVIRVGKDFRTLKQLAGNPKLKSGVYAIVEIIDKPILAKSLKSGFWDDASDGEQVKYRVRIRYIKNLLAEPILLENLNLDTESKDNYLINGLQASTMPLNPFAFKEILSIIGGEDELRINIDDKISDLFDLKRLENKYRDACPEIKEKVSKYIERGSIASKYKELTGHKCQICEAIKENTYSFKNRNNEFYVETHHVIPVSNLESGLLSTCNLITVCANHHRQLHFGLSETIENSDERFVFRIDSKLININKPTIG